MKKLIYLILLITSAVNAQVYTPVNYIKSKGIKISDAPTLVTGNTRQLVRNSVSGEIEEQTIVSGGVTSVSAGTNVTVTGTSTNPIVNATTLVDASETVAGKVSVATQTFGGNKTIIGSSSTVGNAFEVQNLAHTVSFEVMNSGDSKINGMRAGRGGGNLVSNLAFGVDSLLATTTGTNNIAVGYNTLPRNTTGANNVAIGANALSFNTTTNNNIAIGRSALESSTSFSNTAIGYGALKGNSTGNNNLGIGINALESGLATAL